jgi:hypothetical protein
MAVVADRLYVSSLPPYRAGPSSLLSAHHSLPLRHVLHVPLVVGGDGLAADAHLEGLAVDPFRDLVAVVDARVDLVVLPPVGPLPGASCASGATVAPSASARRAISSASRVLPIPGSPASSTRRPWPATAVASAARSSPSSRSRPTKTVPGCEGGACTDPATARHPSCGISDRGTSAPAVVVPAMSQGCALRGRTSCSILPIVASVFRS